jgi:histidine ammonia-lyase
VRCAGVDLRAPLVPAAGTGALLYLLRSHVSGPGPDRYLAPELAAVEAVLASADMSAMLNDLDITVR